MPTPRHRLASSLWLLLSAAVAGGCAGGATLEASLAAPPIEISAADSMKELRFRAEARTSAPVLDGLVRVVVRPEDPTTDAVPAGQVRVTVYRDAAADAAPTDDVVACAAETPVEVPRQALADCDGACSEHFVVVFAAEGLAADTPVTFPVVVEAELIYQYAERAPAGDALALTLE